MFAWLFNNKEWVFSGIGVLILSTILGFFINKRMKTVQKQNSGNNSINIQSTGSINIGNSYKEDNDVRK